MIESNGQHDPIDSGSNGRQNNGRFGSGNRFGKGNPYHKKMHILRDRLLDVVDPDAMGRVGAKLVSMAENGDLEATRILLAYTIGKPPQALSLTGPDGESLGIDVLKLKNIIMEALSDNPEGRHAVARALLSFGNGDDEPSNGIGSGD